MPHLEISNNDHQFFGSLNQKEDDFSWIINQVLRIFWFQALRKPRFENKGNFWIDYVCIKAFVSWYTHKGAFTFIVYLQEYICITPYLQRYIRIMSYPQRGHLHHGTRGTFASWHPYKKHLHRDIPVRRHLHHKIFAFPSLQEDICITIKYVHWHHHR